MLVTVNGSIFNSKAHVLVNPVNTEGVMGAGLALEFKRRYPAMFLEYQSLCKNKEILIGKVHLYRVNSYRWILNFPTKDKWRNPSKMEYLALGFDDIENNMSLWGIRSIAFPALGCGKGGLDWQTAKNYIALRCGRIPVPCEIYAPIPDNNRSFK